MNIIGVIKSERLTNISVSFIFFYNSLHITEGFVEFLENVILGYEVSVLVQELNDLVNSTVFGSP